MLKNTLKNLFKGSLTIPNALCVIRILLVPVFAMCYNKGYIFWAFFILAFSALSDTLDGTIARRFNQISELGKILDPAADKISQVAIAIVLFLQFRGSGSESMRAFSWVFMFFLGKEAVMLVGGVVMLLIDLKPGAAEIYGKVATVVFYLVMGIMVIFGPGIGAIIRYFPKAVLPEPVAMALVGICALLTLIAFLSYMPGVYKQAKEKYGKGK